MRVEKVLGGFDSILVKFDDGREIELYGELLTTGFVVDKRDIDEWSDGTPVSEKEKKEIVDAVEDYSNTKSKTKITFE